MSEESPKPDESQFTEMLRRLPHVEPKDPWAVWMDILSRPSAPDPHYVEPYGPLNEDGC